MRWNRQFSCSRSANGEVGTIFWWVLGSFFDGRGDLKMTPWGSFESHRHCRTWKLIWFYRYEFQMSFQRSESSQNHVQRCDRRWKFENFENFYFLVFRFPWSILHIHLCLWPIHSARVGSPLAFYAFYFVTPSGTGFKHFSVNGLPNKTSSGSVKFQYTIQNEKLGRPCATLIFGRGNSGGTLHCVNDDVFEAVFEALKTHQKPIFDTFWRCDITRNAIRSDRKTFENILKLSKTDLKHLEIGRNRFWTPWKRWKIM